MANNGGVKGDSPITRRNFLKGAGAVTVAGALGGPLWIYREELGFFTEGDADAPLAALGRPLTPKHFLGDDPKVAHGVFWQKANFLKEKGELPKPSQRAKLVVVGGGMSGLLAAHTLREHRPVVLEQAPRFGGNSKGETYRGSAYSWGAAYIGVPEGGSLSGELLKDLGIESIPRGSDGAHPESLVWDGSRIHAEFWAHPSHLRVLKRFRQIAEENYPTVPPLPGAPIELDEVSTLDWLSREFGEDLTPELLELFRRYASSAFAGTLSELSAYQFLNFFLSDMQGVLVFPGGNGFIANRVYEKLKQSLPKNSLRASQLTIEVALHGETVWVSSLNTVTGEITTIEADQVVVTLPKFVAKHVIKDLAKLAPDQLAQMNRIQYRAYVVSELVLDRKLNQDLYSVIPLMPDGELSDVIFSDWAQRGQKLVSGKLKKKRTERTVLSLYRAFPSSSGRAWLYRDEAYAEMKAEMERLAAPVLSALGVKNSDVEAHRMVRIGHAVPLAEVGFLSRKVGQTASRSIGNRIHFANQDVFLNPCFESALLAANDAAIAVDRQFEAIT